MTEDLSNPDSINGKEIRDALHEVFFPLTVNLFHSINNSTPDKLDALSPYGSSQTDETKRLEIVTNHPTTEADNVFFIIRKGSHKVSAPIPFREKHSGGYGEQFARDLGTKVMRLWDFIESRSSILTRHPLDVTQAIEEHQEILIKHTLQDSPIETLEDSIGSLAANIGLMTILKNPSYENPWDLVNDFIHNHHPDKLAMLMDFGTNGELASGGIGPRLDSDPLGDCPHYSVREFIKDANSQIYSKSFEPYSTGYGCPEGILEETPDIIKPFLGEDPPTHVTGIYLTGLTLLSI